MVHLRAEAPPTRMAPVFRSSHLAVQLPPIQQFPAALPAPCPQIIRIHGKRLLCAERRLAWRRLVLQQWLVQLLKLPLRLGVPLGLESGVPTPAN